MSRAGDAAHLERDGGGRRGGGTLIVGAGPAGLASALALRCHGLGDDVEVVDPTGTWLAAWRRRFAAQDIHHLRSPSVHHPHPDPFALLRFGDGDGLVPSGGTQLPTSAMFQRFVDHAIERGGLAGAVTPAAVTELRVSDDGCARISLSDGTQRSPDRLILATNARTPAIPATFADALAATAAGGAADRGTSPAADRGTSLASAPVVLGEHADVRAAPDGGRVVIVGGGLSAGHLAVGAIRRGAHVTLLTRRRLMVRRFDTHPSWLGPKKRRPFERERDALVRRRAIDAARGGGSIPHQIRRELDELEQAGKLTLLERSEPTGIETVGDRVRVAAGGLRLDADRVWLATGGRIDVGADPLCAALADHQPTTVADGLPELEPDLCWPGTRIHLMGFAAALILGPTAGNLIGHRRAAQRIIGRMRGLDPAQADRIATGAGACPAEVAHPPRRGAAAGR